MCCLSQIIGDIYMKTREKLKLKGETHLEQDSGEYEIARNKYGFPAYVQKYGKPRKGGE